ncbi:MAG: AraC family transcriptional regulator [Ruminococcaceae bacterium]|nr:AraC family transcriptional regulator [Oscillospiraceae bacterium]
MLYQKLLMKSMPYHVGISNNGTEFEVHRHPELEFNYCHSGRGYTAFIDGVPYEMSEGLLAISSSMTSHEYIKSDKILKNTMSVTVVVGSVFLGEYSAPFSNASFKSPIFDLKEEKYSAIREIFEKIIKNQSVGSVSSKLIERGLLYELCAHILTDIIEPFSESSDSAHLVSIKKIERALEYINSHYSRDITVAEMASVCGYSESNFCKHFKKITGTSFHTALNKKRLESACIILKSTTLPLDEIAAEVGFSDAKTLCRIFKKEMGITPNKYRKEI